MVCVLCLGSRHVDHHLDCLERLDRTVRGPWTAVPQENAARSERGQEWDDVGEALLDCVVAPIRNEDQAGTRLVEILEKE